MALEMPPPSQVRWPEFSHVIFDCDSTLSTVEGIDVLAVTLGFADEVAALTDAAMAGEIELNTVYAERLRMLRPSKRAVAELRSAYKTSIVPEAREVVQALREIDIEIYVVSGGLADPVGEFAVHLGIDADNVRAVEASHNSLSGEWWKTGQGPVDEDYTGFTAGALTRSDGKAEIISDLLRGKPGRALLVGDGASDLQAAGAVDLFVGFGGVVRRQTVAENSPIYVEAATLAPVLPIAAGPGGAARLGDAGFTTLRRGLEEIELGGVKFRDPAMRVQLLAAMARSRAHHV